MRGRSYRGWSPGIPKFSHPRFSIQLGADFIDVSTTRNMGARVRPWRHFFKILSIIF
ncbi:hypothetical protein C0J52_22909 [Blattella germanica]|nr:hypothetical protein C0J52_22909 [Blattella germanica]